MEYLTTAEVMSKFGWRSRQAVNQVATREGWTRVRKYRCSYLKADVDRYALDREHTAEAKRRGHTINGLIRHGNGATCPVCNGKSATG